MRVGERTFGSVHENGAANSPSSTMAICRREEEGGRRRVGGRGREERWRQAASSEWQAASSESRAARAEQRECGMASHLLAKENGLLREQGEGDKGAREVKVVNVRRDAVALRVKVDDARVGSAETRGRRAGCEEGESSVGAGARRVRVAWESGVGEM